MRADVRSWLAQCGVCVRAKGPEGITRRNPMTIVRSGNPFERIAIIMYGPLPETARGNWKILVITCYFTKWVEAYALPDETAETIAEALVNDFISRYGVPISIHSYQGETSRVRCTRRCADSQRALYVQCTYIVRKLVQCTYNVCTLYVQCPLGCWEQPRQERQHITLKEMEWWRGSTKQWEP